MRETFNKFSTYELTLVALVLQEVLTVQADILHPVLRTTHETLQTVQPPPGVVAVQGVGPHGDDEIA